MHTLQSYEYDQRPFYSVARPRGGDAGHSICGCTEDSAPSRHADNSERSFYFKREKTRTPSPGFRSSPLIGGGLDLPYQAAITAPPNWRSMKRFTSADR